MNNQPLSRVWNLTVLNVDLHSQDVVHFLVIPEYERSIVPSTSAGA